MIVPGFGAEQRGRPHGTFKLLFDSLYYAAMGAGGGGGGTDSRE